MKLSEIFSQEYLLIETEQGIMNVDTSYDEDDYQIKEISSTSLLDLEKDEDTLHIAEKIKQLGAEEAENQKIAVYVGTLKSVSGVEENCTVYAPEFWQ